MSPLTILRPFGIDTTDHQLTVARRKERRVHNALGRRPDDVGLNQRAEALRGTIGRLEEQQRQGKRVHVDWPHLFLLLVVIALVAYGIFGVIGWDTLTRAFSASGASSVAGEVTLR